MSNIPQEKPVVKTGFGIFGNRADVLSLAEQDRATLESDLSGSASPARDSAPAFCLSSPCRVKALNSGGETEGEGAKPPSCPDGLVYTAFNYHNCSTLGIEAIEKKFAIHKDHLEHAPVYYLHLRNETDGSEAICCTDRRSSSRYFEEGRKRIKKKLYKRLGKYSTDGIFMTCTIDPKQCSKAEAWAVIWKAFKGLRGALNNYRMRSMGVKRRLVYLAVVEPHKSGYPHLHVFFPGLRYLIDDLPKLDGWWGLGMVNTQRCLRSQSVRAYVLKYIGKMSGWSETDMAMLWFFHVRLYNMSHGMFRVKVSSDWILLGVSTDEEEVQSWVADKLPDLYTVKFVLIHSP